MGKLGRIRKFSHSRYKKALNAKKQDDHRADPESPVCSLFASLPNKFKFPLRSLPSVILDQPSIVNFTYIFTLLEYNNAFNNQWNLIKHSQPFLMLCNFSTDNRITPDVKRTLIVNTDLTWNVIIGHKNTKAGVVRIPVILRNSGDFVNLFNMVDTYLVCPGICDSDLIKLATAGNRHGSFEDRHGNVKAQLHDGDTVRPINCSAIVEANTGVLCGECKSYRHSLLAMLSKERRLSKTSLFSESQDESSRTSINSHCAWKHLTEQERKMRVKNCTLDRQKNSRKIARLENKFRKESITLQPDDNNVVESLFNNLKMSCPNSQDPEDFKTLFLQQQENAMKCSDKRGRRWHPLIIRWCFQLHSTSPKAYKCLRIVVC